MSTQRVDRKEYRRVRPEGAAKEKSQGPENEIRVTAQRGQRSYISYAIAVLKGEEGKAKQDTIKVSGMGAAIYNAVNIAEIVKRRVAGLHQTTEIASETVKDSYEGIESKKSLDVERKVATILITLSTKALDTKSVGYQAPLPEDQVVEQEERKPSERRGGRGSGRGSGRGGRGGRGSARGGRGGRRGGDRAEKKVEEKPAGRGRGRSEPVAERGGRGTGRGSARGGRTPAADKPAGERAGRGSARGGRGSGRGGSTAAAAKPADKPAKAAKPDYQKLGDEFEDKLDRQKGEGHNKTATKANVKPKSSRVN